MENKIGDIILTPKKIYTIIELTEYYSHFDETSEFQSYYSIV